MNTAQALDHVGIAGADLAALSAAYERLGFTLTPPARHSGRRTPEGPIVPSAPATAAPCCARAISS